jgi:hypothetical protein
MGPLKKPRLELTLYARPKHPGTYHYALFESPKGTEERPTNFATKHHVKNTLLVTSDAEPSQP